MLKLNPIRSTLSTIAIAGLMGGCGAKTAQAPAWIDVAQAEGDGFLEIENRGDGEIHRLWLVHSRSSELREGFAPETFERVAVGETFSTAVPMGWWDVWIERADGADVVLFGAWFGSGQKTRFVVEPAWWRLGDWVDAQSEGIEPRN